MLMYDQRIRLAPPPKLAAVVVSLILIQGTFAQTNPSRAYNEQLRVLLDQQVPTQRDVTLNGGGWFSFGFFDFDDATAANKERTLRQSQLRGWASINKQDTHEFYVRGLYNYDDWNSNTNPRGKGDDSDEELERAWYTVNVNRFLDGDVGNPVNLRLKVGRAFQTIGSAFTMSMPLDLLSINADIYDWQLTSFVGKTIFRSNNIDQSAQLYNRQDRILWGTEIAYDKLSNHRPFGYFLANWDHTDPMVPSSSQSFKYDSRYVGIGSRGILGSDDLRYSVELVGEWGESYASAASSGTNNIEAYAFDLLLEYYVQHPTRPRLMFEYMFGTGDPDRTTSSVATTGGNTAGTNDRAFNAFGFRDTGIAFAPSVSNLHIYVGGVSLFPFDHCEKLKRLEAGSKVFLYTKDRDRGATSDTSDTIANGGGLVGSEWDVFLNWRITSDLVGTLRYGMFHPGSAYDGGDKTPRDFLYSGLLVSF